MALLTFDQCFVLLWSSSQARFHTETVEEMLHSNWDTYLHRKNVHSDWIVVGFGDTVASIELKKAQLKRQLDEPDTYAPEIPPEEQL